MVVFLTNDKETRRKVTFIKKHKKCFCNSASGGKISYVYTPDLLGYTLIIKCNTCEKEKDITDLWRNFPSSRKKHN
jgi:hypothetical protein